MSGRRVAVVAVGGNALITDSQHKSLPDQRLASREAMKHVVGMVEAGWTVAVTHGNGPQVGFLLRRAELAHDELPEIPLDVCGADTQGATGYLFASELNNEFHRRGLDKQAVAMVTQTVVDADDPAFDHPTKPIGSFRTVEEATLRHERDGWQVVEDAGRGWRRVVASPVPQRILELEAIKSLIDAGFIVVAAGGGGIPVTQTDAGEVTGVEAVIDKDLGTAILASALGAEVLLISTAVEAVAVDFNTPAQRWLSTITAAQAREYLEQGQFGAGSMEPKVRAAVQYLEAGGRRAIITDPEHMVAALAGEAGTTIVP